MDGLYNQIRIALHQVWRRRWLAAGVAWGVAVLGWLVIALIPNSYEAKARLFIQQQQVFANLPGSTGASRLTLLGKLAPGLNFAPLLQKFGPVMEDFSPAAGPSSTDTNTKENTPWQKMPRLKLRPTNPD